VKNVTSDVQSIKLQLHKGDLWYLDSDKGFPRRANVPPAEFLALPRVARIGCVRATGSAANTKLLLYLYSMKEDGRLQSVALCTPLVCPVAKQRKDPQAVLMAMRTFDRAASVGGFHEMTTADRSSYALADALYSHTQGDTLTKSCVAELLCEHPAWRALSFIKSLNGLAVAGLLAHIGDPRWYIDPCKPNSMAKLYAWLGLCPQTQAGVTTRSPQGRYHRRCKLVQQCWKDLRVAAEIRDRFDLCTPVPVPDSELPGVASYDFVWRAWGHQMRLGTVGVEPGDVVVADLHASQRFIAFLRHTWLSELYRDSTALPDQGASLFRPADFFRHSAEVAAYELHQLRLGMI